MSDETSRLRAVLTERVLRGPGRASPAARQAAFDNRDVPGPARALIDTVARHAWRVTDQDVAAVTAAGMPDDEVFELAVCAAIGQASRQLEAARAALAQAIGEPPTSPARPTPDRTDRTDRTGDLA
jgi:hypothetical protein